jgi:hypothetical protein
MQILASIGAIDQTETPDNLCASVYKQIFNENPNQMSQMKRHKMGLFLLIYGVQLESKEDRTSIS